MHFHHSRSLCFLPWLQLTGVHRLSLRRQERCLRQGHCNGESEPEDATQQSTDVYCGAVLLVGRDLAPAYQHGSRCWQSLHMERWQG